MLITRAVIPAAGLGTRMRPASLAIPKELFPLGNRPAIHWVIEEAVAAGVDEIAVVLRPGKELIRTYLERAREAGSLGPVSFQFPLQPEPTGLADAIARCREFAAGQPFALLLPDNILLSPRHQLRRMTALAEHTGRDVVGVIELGDRDSGLYGNSGRIDYQTVRDGVLRIDRLHDKLPGTLEVAAGQTIRRTCGRYVCQPRLFARIERLRSEIRGEVDEVPVYQQIAAEGGLLGLLLPPPLFDVGHPPGYLAASAYLAGRPRSG